MRRPEISWRVTRADYDRWIIRIWEDDCLILFDNAQPTETVARREAQELHDKIVAQVAEDYPEETPDHA